MLRVMELGGAKEDPAFRQLFTAQSIPDATPEQTRAFNELMRASGGTKGYVSRFLRHALIEKRREATLVHLAREEIEPGL